jgi:hypothetical protein
MMLFAFLSSFFACEPIVACDEMAVYSVTLEILDEAGLPIVDAEIAYTVDGEEGLVVEGWGDGNYVVGIEEAGDFEISIHVDIPNPDDECCWKEGTANLALTITSDECHVVPQSLTPELDWVDVCADSEDCG